MFVKLDAVEEKACGHVANAFLTRFELIWLISRLEISLTPKNEFFAKSSRSQWVKAKHCSTDHLLRAIYVANNYTTIYK